jgi:hypothetical protein
MRQMFQEFSWRNLRSSAKSMGLASYALIAVLFALLIFAVVIAALGWQSAPGTEGASRWLCHNGSWRRVLRDRWSGAHGTCFLQQPERLRRAGQVD